MLTRTRIAALLNRLFPALVIAAAAGVWMMPLLLTGGWYDSHEYYRYPWLVQLFADSLSAGISYPRWLPQINGGYGYPTFVFYQPAFFYLAGLFQMIFDDPVPATYAAMLVIFMFAATGAYRLARMHGRRAESLAFALIFLATPYLIYNYVERGDLTELMAMAFGPWLLRYLLLMARTRSFRHTAIFALLIAGQCYSHLFVAAPMIGVLAVLVVVKLRELGWPRDLLKAYLAAFAGGIILSSPHWWTLLQMKNTVEYAAAISDYFITTNHVHSFSKLAADYWRVPFALSLPGFFLARRDAFTQGVFGVMVALVLMTHTISRPIWEHVHLLDYFQFPWRFYAIIACLQLWGMVQLVRLRAIWSRRAFEAVLCLALLASVAVEAWHFKFPAGLDFNAVRNYLPWQFETLNNRREFDPRTMQNLFSLQDRRRHRVPFVEAVGEAASQTRIEPDYSGLPYRIAFKATVNPTRRLVPQAAPVLINQLYYPGWKVTVNGTPIQSAGPQSRPFDPVLQYDAHGRLLIKLPGEGVYHVAAWYAGPPGWALRNLLIVVMIASLILWLCCPRLPAQVWNQFKKGLSNDS